MPLITDAKDERLVQGLLPADVNSAIQLLRASLRAALAAKDKAEGALRSVAGAVGVFANADGKNIVEKIEFLWRDWEQRGEVWREKKRVLENDLGKAWEENKRLREELRTGLAMTTCPACGSETANTNESRLNVENKGLREAVEWACEHAEDFGKLVHGEYNIVGFATELRRRAGGKEGRINAEEKKAWEFKGEYGLATSLKEMWGRVMEWANEEDQSTLPDLEYVAETCRGADAELIRLSALEERCGDVEGLEAAIKVKWIDEGFKRVDFSDNVVFLAVLAVQKFLKEGKSDEEEDARGRGMDVSMHRSVDRKGKS